MKNILLVEDHAVVREGLKKMLEQPGVTSFGEAATGAEAMRLFRGKRWDIVVLDIYLDGRSGLEVLKELKQISPKLPVLILSMHSEEQYARRAFKAGASGYVTKDSPRSVLIEAVNKVIGGGKYVSPTLAENLVINLDLDIDRPLHELLSDREFEVMTHIASGKTVGEIAVLLSLSDRTISTYRARILDKMGMKTSAELTHYAIQNKLVD
ncbi:MAG: hypothetical protein QOJ64_2374 [Acidobacteriota bacterium]|jgi:DNA-binding NarL/FixJ family response regulator|nr:hypothetical protein [Acidobacteriota bacterium]